MDDGDDQIHHIHRMRQYYSSDYIPLSLSKNNNGHLFMYFFRSDMETIFFRKIYFRKRNKKGFIYYFGNDERQIGSELYYMPISLFRNTWQLNDNDRYTVLMRYEKWQRKEFLPLWRLAKSNPYYSFDHTIHHEDCDDKEMMDHVPIITAANPNILCCYSCRAIVDLEWYPCSTFSNETIWSMWELNSCPIQEAYHFYIQWLPEELLQDIIEICNLYSQ
jgi:hypothetical protein